MDDRFTTRLRSAMNDAPSNAAGAPQGGPPPGGPPPDGAPPPDMRVPGVPLRTPLYVRGPSRLRRIAAVLVGVALLALAAWWVDSLVAALVLWVLFSLFVLLWPNWPPLTAAEERAQAWPFET